jgi:hypothetical protein
MDSRMRGHGGASLPAEAVLTNLRSPTGRVIYLIARAGPEQAAELSARAEEMAAKAQARVKIRPAGDLLVLLLWHKEQGLDVHRRGRHLSIDPGPPTPVRNALAAGVRLSERWRDADMDQEILLKARSVMREGEPARKELVTLAQGAAARRLLARYAVGDDVGAALLGQRHLPLLVAHPDAALLRTVLSAAQEALAPADRPPGPAPAGPAAELPAPWQEALSRAQAVARAAGVFIERP